MYQLNVFDDIICKKVKLHGKIKNCDYLEIREFPDTSSKILCTVYKDTELLIEEIYRSSNFYKVCTPWGIEGYCNNRYVKLNT